MQTNNDNKQLSLNIPADLIHSSSSLPLVKFPGFEKILETLNAIKEGMRFMIENMHPSLRKLANHGWYMSGDLTPGDGMTLALELHRGNTKMVDNYFQKLYDKEAKGIIYRLKKDYPERRRLLSEALKAHNNKMYFASTSLFLSVADGLCHGLLFKSKKGKKPKLTENFTNRSPIEEIIAVITEVNAIDDAHHKKNNYQSALNRHGVMHGLDFDYGTKINSLKALSLLTFITDFLVRPSKV